MNINQVVKIISYIFYALVAKHMPGSNSIISFGSKRIRAICAKGMLNQVGKNINIERGAQFSTKVEIGDNSGIGLNCFISGKTLIGKNVMMAPEVYIYTFNHSFGRTDIPMCEQGRDEEEPVIIEDDVWIGSRTTILPGVKIGRGSIIGAMSVVTKNVEAYTVVAGNPAKTIKSRI